LDFLQKLCKSQFFHIFHIICLTLGLKFLKFLKFFEIFLNPIGDLKIAQTKPDVPQNRTSSRNYHRDGSASFGNNKGPAAGGYVDEDESEAVGRSTDRGAAGGTGDQKNAFKKRAIALWDYVGDDEYEQIAFKAGDEIVVLEEDDESGWWWGELDGKEGYFPVNYTEVRKPDIKVNQELVDPKIKAIQASLTSQV